MLGLVWALRVSTHRNRAEGVSCCLEGLILPHFSIQISTREARAAPPSTKPSTTWSFFLLYIPVSWE